MSPRAATFWLIPVLLLCACKPAVQSVPVTVGVHHVRFVVPEGWNHFDRGREQRFEKELAQISLSDLGPVTPEGFVREITRARDLFRRGQRQDARAVVSTLSPRHLFSSNDRFSVFEEPWRVVRRSGEGSRPDPPATVERAYGQVIQQISVLAPSRLETLALAALEQLGHDERRDVAERQAMVVDGRVALRLDTWERLSHAGRKRHVFVVNEENLLVGRMELGTFAEMQPAFDALVESLTLPQEKVKKEKGEKGDRSIFAIRQK